MSRDEFEDWLVTAAPGDRCTYHEGHLADDRRDSKDTPCPIGKTASAALRAAEAGQVHLVQKANGSGFSYLAIRRSGGAA